MTERVSDERLAELIGDYDAEAGRMRGIGYHEDDGDILEQHEHTAAALRELQQLRHQIRARQSPGATQHIAMGLPRCGSCGEAIMETYHRCQDLSRRLNPLLQITKP